MHSAIAAGSSSSCAPSASSRSADPDWPVFERPPCFATAQPAPAATMAAVVDTLNVGRPPPVPQVSSRSIALDDHGVRDRSRIVRAKPTAPPRSRPWCAARSGRPRSGRRRLAVPPSPRASTSASVVDGEIDPRGRARRATASVRTGFGRQRRFPRGSSASRRLPHSVRIVSGWNCTPSTGSSRCADPHDHAIAEACRGHSRQSGRPGSTHQRVVARRGAAGSAGPEDALPSCSISAVFPCTGSVRGPRVPPNASPMHLVPEADAEHRHAASASRGSTSHRDPRLGRRARTRRDHDRPPGSARAPRAHRR